MWGDDVTFAIWSRSGLDLFCIVTEGNIKEWIVSVCTIKVEIYTVSQIKISLLCLVITLTFMNRF